LQQPEHTTPAVQPVALHRPGAKVTLPEAATWPLADVIALFELPFNALMFRALEAHRANFPDGDVELATLLSIKTGGCEEDCSYCPQAARYDTDVEAKKLLDLDTVPDAEWQAKENGATLGMLEDGQADRLKSAGLDCYNHNLDTAPEFYNNVISTRECQDRLDTLGRVRHAGLKVCCGGIVGMGETRPQRAGLIAHLTRWNLHEPLQWLASRCRKPACDCRLGAVRWTKQCKQCVSWPAPTPFFMTTSC